MCIKLDMFITDLINRMRQKIFLLFIKIFYLVLYWIECINTRNIDRFRGMDLAKYNILMKRINFNLNKIICKKSQIHGNGIFAKKYIKQGEIITMYPSDYLEYNTHKFINELAFNRGFYEMDASIDYAFSIDSKYIIYGEPLMNTDTNYMGHLINEAYKPLETDSKMDYQINSDNLSNCYFYIINGLHLVIIAKQNINIGDELLISYGPNYWFNSDRIKKN